jgi:hypothetical protein
MGLLGSDFPQFPLSQFPSFWHTHTRMRLHTIHLGQSVEDRALLATANFDPHAVPLPTGITLLLAGTHGDEPATQELLLQFERVHLAGVPTPTIVCPLINPDGIIRHARYNARGVDLNRNAEFRWSLDCEEPPGAAPWSEPESGALRDLILRMRPAKIVTLHWALAELDADGAQSFALLEAMWSALSDAERRPYRQRLTAAPPADGLTGSLGGWCGYALHYPDDSVPAIVTLELPASPELPRPAELPADHLATVHARWRDDAAGYLQAVEPGVTKMLLAACACPA